MGHRNVYRLDYIQDIFTVKWLAAALLVTVLCFCSRFYDAFTGQEMLLIRAFFQYTGEELLAMGETASSFQAAVGFRDCEWFVVLLPVLAAFPWTDRFMEQWTGGSYYLMISRRTRNRYALGNMAKAAVTGFSVLAAGILLYILMVWLRVPAYQVQGQESMIAWTYGATVMERGVYLARAVIHTSLLGAACAMVSILLAAALRDRFFALSIPMLAAYASDKLSDAWLYYVAVRYDFGTVPEDAWWPGFLFPSQHLFYDTNFTSTFGLGYSVYLAFLLGLLALMAAVFLCMVKRRNV